MRMILNPDKIKEKIGTTCKWICYSVFIALILGTIIACFIANWWVTLIVIIVVAVIVGWIEWGVDYNW